MKFALVNNERQEAQPQMLGICPVCGQQVIAKCGEHKVRHWAHKKLTDCDQWWESETLWHRQWKDKFPKEWQEVIDHDKKTGEKHVADIRTNTGLVIEFQHSAIKPEEQRSREQFHKTMVWVVDCTRCPSYWKRFTTDWRCGNRLLKSSFFSGGDLCLPEIWQDSKVAVIFDFLGTNDIQTEEDEAKTYLYCLLPDTDGYYVKLERETFINKVMTNTLLTSISEAPNKIKLLLDKRESDWQKQLEAERRAYEKQEYEEMKKEYCIFDLPNSSKNM